MKDTTNPSVSPSNIQDYRFSRIPFGIILSAFLLGVTIETHLDLYNSDVARKLQNDIYVDNVITGSEKDSETITLYMEAKHNIMLKYNSVHLPKWLSNSDEVSEIILKVKLLLQDLWSRNVNWHYPVGATETKLSWNALQFDIDNLSDYTPPRCLTV